MQGWWIRMLNNIELPSQFNEDQLETLISILEEDHYFDTLKSFIDQVTSGVLETLQDIVTPIQLTVCDCGTTLGVDELNRGYCPGCLANVSILIQKDE